MKTFFASLATLLVLSAATPARAEEPTSEAAARRLVDEAVIAPELEKRTERFSRAPMPKRNRMTTRLEASTDQMDKRQLAFRPYVVVASEGNQREVVVAEGCVYPSTREVYVKRKARFFPAALLKGKRVPEAPAGTCIAN